jgi:hypothetical protein
MLDITVCSSFARPCRRPSMVPVNPSAEKPVLAGYLGSAGDGTRTHTRLPSPDFLSPPCSGTGIAMEGQGRIKPRFYRGLDTFEGTQRDRGRHPVAVRLRSKTHVV